MTPLDHMGHTFSARTPRVWLPIFFSFLLFSVAPEAYGSSQARGRFGAIAAGLHHSHSNAGSEPSLRPTTIAHRNTDP